MKITTLIQLLIALSICASGAARADVFNLPAGETSIVWTPIGNPGNAPDPLTGHGAVGYSYYIAQYEVTNFQYAAFLNAVAATDPYGVYSTFEAGSTPPQGINRNGSPGSYSYAVVPGSGNLPIANITWADAARFTNWIANGQPAGGETLSTTESGSYYLNGATTNAAFSNVSRESNATAVIPNEDEWYKAAYYNPGAGTYSEYPTQSNSTPANGYSNGFNHANYGHSPTTGPDHLTTVGTYSSSPSFYGTFDQGGNADEWDETQDQLGDRQIRGGAFDLDANTLLSTTHPNYNAPLSGSDGFRVASLTYIVPEPGSLALLASGAAALLAWGCRRRLASA